jgi:hypothetical protein
MLEPQLQSRYWPDRSSAMVQQAALLFKELPQRLHARSGKSVAPRGDRFNNPLRVALLPDGLRVLTGEVDVSGHPHHNAVDQTPRDTYSLRSNLGVT